MNDLEQVDLGALNADALTKLIKPIIGLPLVDLWHPCFQVFEFGPVHYFKNRKGQSVMRGMWVLDIECDWAVTKGSTVVLGSDDAAKKRKFYHRKTPPRDPNARRRWREAQSFFKSVVDQELVVAAIELEDTGFMRVRLGQDYAIHVFNTSSENGPLWHLRNTTTGVSHDVSSVGGVVMVTKFIGKPDEKIER